MAGDISTGPDYLSRVLANTFDEDEIDPGEAPVSALEKLSIKFAEERAKAMARVTRRRKAEKLVLTITIEDTIAFGSGDAARLETAVAHSVKTAKPAPIKGRKAWLDGEGNQIGQEPAQTTIKGLDGGRSEDGRKPGKKAV
jgi:hypothetical protein